MTFPETTDKLPPLLIPQPEGGYTVTCPSIPELVTETDSVRVAVENASDALTAIIQALEGLGRPLPAALQKTAPDAPIWLETAIVVGRDIARLPPNWRLPAARSWCDAVDGRAVRGSVRATTDSRRFPIGSAGTEGQLRSALQYVGPGRTGNAPDQGRSRPACGIAARTPVSRESLPDARMPQFSKSAAAFVWRPARSRG